MSIKIMSAVFESKTLGPIERLVMLSLADHCDDDGRCYPSIQRLCERTGLSERAVQSNISKLRDAGYIRVESGGGRSRSNMYFISPNPAADAPIREVNPAPETPYDVHPRTRNTVSRALNPASGALNPAADAPEPSITIKEPSKQNGPGFDAFWSAWPNKNAKVAAEKAWRKLSAADRTEAAEKCAAWFAAWRRGNPSASPILPASFLNGRRWEDGAAPIPKQEPQPQSQRRDFWRKVAGD